MYHWVKTPVIKPDNLSQIPGEHMVQGENGLQEDVF